MGLIDALRNGAGFYDDLKRGRILDAQARYADPMAEGELYKLQTENEYLPEKLRLANQYQGLANNYQGLVNKWYGPSNEAAIREKNFFANNPLLRMGGAAGQVGAALYLNGLGKPMNGGVAEPARIDSGASVGLAAPLPGQSNDKSSPNNDFSDYILKSLNSTNNARDSRANLDKTRADNYNWFSLPAETRNNIVAQGLGMGVDPVKMKNYINSGLSIPQIAEKEGLDPNNIPPPAYFPTVATKTRVQQVQQVGAELDYLSSATTPIIGRNADTFANISPQRLKDMFSNDPESQKRFGEYIGALSVQTGLANGRVLLEGGRPGIEIMRAVKDSALKGIDQHSPIKMSRIAFETAQNTIDRILQKGAKIRTMTGMSPFAQNNNQDRRQADRGETANLDDGVNSPVSQKETSPKTIKIVRRNGKLVMEKD